MVDKEQNYQTWWGSPNDCLASTLRQSVLLRQTKATCGEKDGETMAADGVRERSVCLASDTDNTERTCREQGSKGECSRDSYYVFIKLRNKI